ncbi:MAG: DUF3857 domain-containing protein [Lutibacter sp.]
MIKRFFTSLFFLSISFSSFSQKLDYSVLAIPDSLKTNANSVILSDDVVVTIQNQNSITSKNKMVITVLNKLGNSFADITLYYDKRRTIKTVMAYVYDAFGNEIKKIKKSDFKDYSASDGFSLYNDGRFLHYNYIPTSYPYTIEVSYEIKSSNTANIPSWYPFNGYTQSIKSSTYTINYPPSFKLQKSEKNLDKFIISKKSEGGKLTYQASNLRAIAYEPYAPSFREIAPNVKFAVNEFSLEGVTGISNNWKEFGNWVYNNLIKNTQQVPEGTKQKMIDLTKKEPDTIEKAKLIYNYVQNKVRYISVQVGIGGYKPMLAKDVDRLGYGDCKALTNYTAALLKSVGIQSYHTIIYGGDRRDVDKKVVTPQGNHMILYLPIEHKNIWLECTSQKVPFGNIADFTDNRDAIVITPQGGKVLHTRTYKATDNLQFTTGVVSVKDNGGIHAQVNIKSYGAQYNNHLGKFDGENPKDLEVSLKKYFANINNIQFSNTQVSNRKEKGYFEENLNFKADDYSTLTNNQLMVKINALNRVNKVPKRVKNRKLPFEIETSYYDVDSVKVSIPKNFKINYLPETKEIASTFGNYHFIVNKCGESNLCYVRKLKIKSGVYDSSKYDDFRKFMKKIRKVDNSILILTK